MKPLRQASSATLDRRAVLRLCGLSAFAVGLGPARDARARDPQGPAADGVGSYDGPLLLVVHAGGGYDPTSFCDPKGQPAPDTPGAVNRYLQDEIRVGRGDLRWAPFADNDAFFSRYQDRLRILNGVDLGTNGHEAGTRHAHTGDLAEGGVALGALLAAVRGSELPLPFITNGGYDATRGLITRTRVGNLDALRRIAAVNQRGADPLAHYHAPGAFAAIQAAQAERLAALEARPALPGVQASLARFRRARASENVLARMVERLTDLADFRTDLGRQGAVALAAWAGGLTAAASLTVGGFDTHGDHDRAHAVALTRLTQGLDELWQHVERLGVADRVLLMVASDFGRTPWYNEGNGKDHWPLSSVLFLGAGVVPGSFGATDAGYRTASRVDPATLALDPEGIALTPGVIHRALRAHLGIAGTPLDRAWPVQGAPAPILG